MRILGDDVPVWAERLGLAGLVPFVGLALATLWGGDVAAVAIPAVLLYGAAILSFMGGVQWGIGCAVGDAGLERLGASVVPALVAWVATLVGGGLGLVLLIAGLGLLLLYDRRTVAEGRSPPWYMELRRPLTAVAMASLFVALLHA